MAGPSEQHGTGSVPVDRTESERRRRAERFAEQLAIRDRETEIRESQYEALVKRHTALEADLERALARVTALEGSLADDREWRIAKEDELWQLHHELASRDAALAELRAQLASMRSTRVWRLATTWWRWRGRR
jgi:chromosome segregation ATPase